MRSVTRLAPVRSQGRLGLRQGRPRSTSRVASTASRAGATTRANRDAQGNPALATSLANVPGTVDIPVVGNGSYLRFRGTNAQDDVAETLTDVMSVAELGVRVGHAN